ncbi:hypothetical protein TNCV_5066321 [Trichonephila clavipes]|nr:hypothetical protein TNCV_5066321 [Trichonephila clavipes]
MAKHRVNESTDEVRWDCSPPSIICHSSSSEVWRGAMPAQMSSTSRDRSSKLGIPSSTTLVLLYRVTLINNRSVRDIKEQWCPEKLLYIFHSTDEAHFWLNGYVNKQNCHIWSEANPQVYVETPLHPEKLTVWCALWAGGILLQKR